MNWPNGKFAGQLIERAINMRIATPSEFPGLVENLFGSQFQNHIGIRADKNFAGGKLAKQTPSFHARR